LLHDANDLAAGTVLAADICIVGAGAAGITLARDLADSGLDVCVLESGGLGVEAASQALYEGVSSGIQARLLPARSRRFGGTTDHWAGYCRPLEPEDLQDQSWMTETGWPLTYEELLPYYRRAQRTCQGGAYDYDAEALARRAGTSVLPLDPTRVRTVAYQFSAPLKFGDEYREELSAAPRVAVYLHANVVDVVLQANGAAVRELRCKTLGGGEFVARAQHYVLALGGIETPRLLLASNGVQPAGVGNEHGMVGPYFMEHPHWYSGCYLLLRQSCDLAFYSKTPTLTVDDEFPAGQPVRVQGALALAHELRLREGLPTMAVTLSAQARGRTGEIETERIAPLLRLAGEGTKIYTGTIRAEQRPIATSYIRLAAERDPLGMPRVDLHWAHSPLEWEAAYRTHEVIAAELARAGLGRLYLPNDGLQVYTPTSVEGGGHHLGATRMSDSPQSGAVDRDCRVHGVANLSIASSSVFPTGGFANPTLTIVALAHRMADRLREMR